MATYTGSCHCKAVTFEFDAPLDLTVINCNCSICTVKNNSHVIVPEANLRVLSGQNNLTEYRFNTMQAVHLFCKTCGVQPFYKPRSNPDGYGVIHSCIDTSPARSVSFESFDGRNWEAAFESSDISKYSKS